MEAKRFDKVHIEISNVCNLQCSFCPEVKRAKHFMDEASFVKIISQLPTLTKQVCLHLMGEPLLHPLFARFVELCEERGLKIFLVTNGVLLRRKQAALLLNPSFRQVNFSLHSFHNNFGETDPSRYLKNIFDFVRHAFDVRPDLYINFRLWNLEEVNSTSAANEAMLARIEDAFEFKFDRQLDVKKKKSYHIKGRLYLHFDTEFVWPALDLPLLGDEGRCYGLSTHFGILADGTVVPCCLDKEGRIALGNIHERSIAEILDEPKAARILKGFQNGKLLEDLCKRCQYITRFKQKAPRSPSVAQSSQ